jgi:PAS domain S-box-containing protein
VSLTSSVAGDGALEERLPPHPASVARAREVVRLMLEAHGRDDLVDTAVLLVSEVVTNALLHAGSEIHLVADLDDTGLRVAVGDGSPHLPSRRRYAATAGTGRGLLMLESMVDDWGVTPQPEGKIVWFRLSGRDDDQPDGPRPDRAGAPRPGAGDVSVELRNVPLLLHVAWQEHAEALLREYLLASLDTGGEDPIQLHADATDAIALLEEHLPTPDVALRTDALLDDAVEPWVSARVVHLPVPVASVAHFETLDRTIEAAMDLSIGGLVLTPPTQPEVQAFRRWICRQVLRQAAGARPEPWRLPMTASTDVPVLDGWDAREVSEAEDGLVAADSTSRILAVSRVAAGLLGYDDPGELVGQRIVTIIPERYRQAHVAGFTMYLLVGRKPLVDRTVTVPALRRDGVEVEVELTVRVRSAPDGQRLMVAEMRPAPS